MGDDLIESIARAQHENYLREQVEHGETVRENPSLVSWDELPAALKQSNRRFAEGVAAKLEEIEVKIVRAEDAPDFAFTGTELEMLARMEHDRWAADLVRDGWRPGDVKDPESKTHPMLVDWDELSEAERDKDRDAVRKIPATLRLAGFRLERG
jgi:hypothetical protein